MKWIHSSRGQNSASYPYQDQFGWSKQLSAEVQKKNKEESSEKIWLEKIGNVLILTAMVNPPEGGTVRDT